MGSADRPEPAPVLSARALVAGRVQGVFFRASVARVAADAGVSGWAANLPDGSVELRVQGDPPAVRSVLAWAERGPPGARVDRLEVAEVAPDPSLEGFAVR